MQKIAATEAMYLGVSLSFAGDTLVVGAPLATRDLLFQGVVQLYEFNGERWVLDAELIQGEPRENRRFGNTVLADDDRIFTQAFNEVTAVSRGAVHSFDRQADGRWVQADRWVPMPVEFAAGYGRSMATNGEHLIIGASDDQAVGGGDVGAAYFFDLTCGACEADLDADGSLTIFDFLAFFNAFDVGDPIADFDGDGELTIFDFLAFQTAFDAGC